MVSAASARHDALPICPDLGRDPLPDLLRRGLDTGRREGVDDRRLGDLAVEDHDGPVFGVDPDRSLVEVERRREVGREFGTVSRGIDSLDSPGDELAVEVCLVGVGGFAVVGLRPRGAVFRVGTWRVVLGDQPVAAGSGQGG